MVPQPRLSSVLRVWGLISFPSCHPHNRMELLWCLLKDHLDSLSSTAMPSSRWLRLELSNFFCGSLHTRP